jgi:Rrf2 family protein
MRLSRATGYALHAFAYLAKQKDAAPVSTKVIAKATGIPDVFLLKALKPCVARQLLDSITGPRGGYRLARQPEEITVLEVIEAVEGPLVSSSSFRSTKAPSAVDRAIQHLLNEATACIREVFEGMTIAQLAGLRNHGRSRV